MMMPPPTQRELDCTSLARDALFPLKISRDGSHPTQFPASEALAKMRTSGMKTILPDRAASSFFPRRVVVVRDVSASTWKWNGQPDVEGKDASIEVIPDVLSVRSQHCGDGREAFVERDDPSQLLRRIVLCSDRVLQRDYSHAKTSNTPRSLAKIEEVLAHHVTRIEEQLKSEQQGGAAGGGTEPDSSISCSTFAAMEIRAARAAECYYSKAGREVTRGSSLGAPGYSLFPSRVQELLRNRCIRSVATRATEQEFGSDGGKCVAQVFVEANQDRGE